MPLDFPDHWLKTPYVRQRSEEEIEKGKPRFFTDFGPMRAALRPWEAKGSEKSSQQVVSPCVAEYVLSSEERHSSGSSGLGKQKTIYVPPTTEEIYPEYDDSTWDFISSDH